MSADVHPMVAARAVMPRSHASRARSVLSPSLPTARCCSRGARAAATSTPCARLSGVRARWSPRRWRSWRGRWASLDSWSVSWHPRPRTKRQHRWRRGARGERRARSASPRATAAAVAAVAQEARRRRRCGWSSTARRARPNSRRSRHRRGAQAGRPRRPRARVRPRRSPRAMLREQPSPPRRSGRSRSGPPSSTVPPRTGLVAARGAALHSKILLCRRLVQAAHAP